MMVTRAWFPGEKPDPVANKAGRKAKMNLLLGGHAFLENPTKAEDGGDDDITTAQTQHVLLALPVPKHCNHLLK